MNFKSLTFMLATIFCIMVSVYAGKDDPPPTDPGSAANPRRNPPGGLYVSTQIPLQATPSLPRPPPLQNPNPPAN
ncbi:uncharacterized protein LOC126845795 [Adelges cooleyi]|uniref:uncharacterized protein LOC126845795 n=1 Tax=Adelges cooleyi TaxID=133065 RepID=UPI00217FAC6C|nr:uncharacterized protein LOC126845795 [Adelges cooleyi]